MDINPLRGNDREKPKKEIQNHVIAKSRKINLFAKGLNYLGYPLAIEHKMRLMLNEIPEPFEVASFPYSSFRLHELEEVKKADVIHLHWISNFIDIGTFFAGIQSPIVWTLHDMNPFLGTFHYQNDHNRHVSTLPSWHNQIIKDKKKYYPTYMSLVSPSQWLMNEAQKSEIVGRYDHFYIPHSLPIDKFRLQDKLNAKVNLGIPSQAKMLLFVSHNTSLYRKGIDLIFDAIRFLKGNDIQLVSVGTHIDELAEDIIQLGYVQSQDEMAGLYNAADLLLMPSREEALGNVVLESFACGTPVIAFNTGGPKDIIAHKKNGFLCDSISGDALALGIIDFLENGVAWSRQKISTYAHECFNPELQVSRYLEIYKKVLRSNS